MSRLYLQVQGVRQHQALEGSAIADAVHKREPMDLAGDNGFQEILMKGDHELFLMNLAGKASPSKVFAPQFHCFA